MEIGAKNTGGVVPHYHTSLHHVLNKKAEEDIVIASDNLFLRTVGNAIYRKSRNE